MREYEVDPDDLSAETVAEKTGIAPEHLFKTLAGRGPQWNLFSSNSRDRRAGLQGARASDRDRKVDMVPLKEVQTATG